MLRYAGTNWTNETMQENLRGSVLMVASMAGFALEDMLLKAVAGSLPVGQILVLFGLIGLALFWGLASWRGEPVWTRQALVPAVGWRAASEVLGRVGYTLAIALSPLSTASAVLQATPLVVALGAALFFAERVGWRRWLAIGLGFAGVLIVPQPWGAGFNIASVFAVLGMIGFAGRDLATRAAPRSLSNAVLGVYGFAMLIVSGGVLLALQPGAWVAPGAGDWLRLLVAGAVGVAAYLALTAAMRKGEISVIAPFRYTRLIFAVALGVLIFGEDVTPAMLIGAVLIVGSGLVTLWRARPAGKG